MPLENFIDNNEGVSAPMGTLYAGSGVSYIVKEGVKYLAGSLFLTTLCYNTVLASGDGSNEPGFVAPPKNRIPPKAPPKTISSAETTDPCCCCPVTPQARTEAKRPPQAPILITKLKSENSKSTIKKK